MSKTYSLVKMPPFTPGGITSLISAFNPVEIINSYFEYKKFATAQETERARLSAKRDIVLKALNHQREIIKEYFDRRFEERKAALDRFFALLDNAIQFNNDKHLDVALDSIVSLIRDNPLKDFETFKSQLLDPSAPILEF